MFDAKTLAYRLRLDSTSYDLSCRGIVAHPPRDVECITCADDVAVVAVGFGRIGGVYCLALRWHAFKGVAL